MHGKTTDFMYIRLITELARSAQRGTIAKNHQYYLALLRFFRRCPQSREEAAGEQAVDELLEMADSRTIRCFDHVEHQCVGI
jgi:hypothetical protein